MRNRIRMEIGEKSNTSNLAPIVLFGMLSIICAEVFSGSAPLWMWDLWGLFVVLPLYWGHGLLLWNIALRFKKTSVTHLYLLGIIYGLYESWMTKVIWAGYMGQDPQFGQFLGFAIGEFLVIALFWHAIFSFIIPIFAFHILGSEEGQFFFSKRRKSIFIMVVLIGSIFIPTGLVFDFAATLIAVLSNFLILLVVYLITLRTHPQGFSLESLRLGKRGLGITIAYTLFLYVFLFLALLPERIAPPLTIFLTVLFYLLVIGLFRYSEERSFSIDTATSENMIIRKHVVAGFLLVFLLPLGWLLLGPITEVIGTFLYLGMILAGPILFVIAISKVMRPSH